MLTKKQITEIREHLERSQNPLFLYDNDEDGLCAFLLLRKYIGRGKGVAIKSYPGLSKDYLRRIKELNSDYVFILDKPVVDEIFFEEVEKINIPIVWIDHHEQKGVKIPEFVNYYNPLLNKDKANEPTTFLCYQVSQRKEDMWLALIGCIADKYTPKFYGEFRKKYPELSIDSDDAYDIYYRSQIGKVARMFSFGLKDRITNVVYMQNFLIKAKNPHQVLEEVKENKAMHERYEFIDKKYQKLLAKAKTIGNKSEKIVFFKFAGDLSIASYLSNELMFLFPEKLILVAYENGAKVNLSLRGKNARKYFLDSIKNLKDATGGGHEMAVGGKINLKDLEKFKESVEKLVH